MSVNAIFDAIGAKEDVQKLWDALCKPNKYAGDGIKLDRESVYPVEGEDSHWVAKCEIVKTNRKEHIDRNDFNDLCVDFPTLRICISFYNFSEDGKIEGSRLFDSNMLEFKLPLKFSGKVNKDNYLSFLDPDDLKKCERMVKELLGKA